MPAKVAAVVPHPALVVRPPAAAVPEPPPREHIFPATRLTEVCLRWKDLTAQAVEFAAKASALETAAAADRRMPDLERLAEAGRYRADAQCKHGEAFVLLEQIIIESTPMFERLAQYEGYHHTVDLSILVQAAREKVPRWLQACKVEQLHGGKLFSFFSTCAKNAFRSEVAKQRQHTNRFHATSDSLEKFVGSEDHLVDRHDAAAEVHRRVREISARWGDPQELGAVRFMVDCIVDQDRQPPNKVTVMNGAMFAYGISPELTKFFYQWALFAVRDALFDRVRVPFTIQDVLRQRDSYTFLPDVIDEVGWDAFCRLVVKLGGQRIKLPTAVQMARAHEDYLLRDELDKTDLTPDEMEAIARRRGRSTRNASEIFEQLATESGAHRTGEHPLYREDET